MSQPQGGALILRMRVILQFSENVAWAEIMEKSFLSSSEHGDANSQK